MENDSSLLYPCWIAEFLNVYTSEEDRPSRFRMGAPLSNIDMFEKTVGIKLPDLVRTFYYVVDGQEPDGDFLLDGFQLFSLSRIIQMWNNLCSLLDYFETLPSEPGPGVQAAWYKKEWVPFAGSADGHCLCLDMAPGPNGEMGQVLVFWYNSPEREVVAHSFEEVIRACTCRTLSLW